MLGQPTERTEHLLSPEDVAKVCGLSRRAVYRAIARGELRAARLCNRLRIQPGELERWIGERTISAEPVEVEPNRRATRRIARGSLRAKLGDATEGREAMP